MYLYEISVNSNEGTEYCLRGIEAAIEFLLQHKEEIIS